jgi:hypothetical protein
VHAGRSEPGESWATACRGGASMCSVIRRPDQVAKRATGIALSRPSSRPGKAPGSIECGHTCSEEHPRQDHMARCCQLQGHVEATGASQPPPPRAGGRCQAARVNRPAEPGTMAPGHGWPGWDAHRVGQQTPGTPGHTGNWRGCPGSIRRADRNEWEAMRSTCHPSYLAGHPHRCTPEPPAPSADQHPRRNRAWRQRQPR